LIDPADENRGFILWSEAGLSEADAGRAKGEHRWLVNQESQTMTPESSNMVRTKRKRLERRGWRIGGVDEFPNLTPEEAAFIEVKLAISEHVKAFRQKRRLTQVAAAEKLGSSQSRVA
jgi:hypothetical protein